MSLTLAQKTNFDGFPKAGELIEITGTYGLEAADRAIANILLQHAHDSGRMADLLADWTIPFAELHPGKHESNDRLRASLDRLLSVRVSVPYIGENDEPRLLMTHLFDFFDLPTTKEARAGAMVRYGLPRELVPILVKSNRWGRIKAEVVCAMSSRYAMALYELLALRVRMERCVEVFPVGRFRELLGVPLSAYKSGNDFLRKVIEPAVLEINGLSDIGVKIEVRRKNPRAPIDSVIVAWWRAEGDAFRDALRERERSKLGRSARLRGKVEELTDAAV